MHIKINFNFNLNLQIVNDPKKALGAQANPTYKMVHLLGSERRSVVSF